MAATSLLSLSDLVESATWLDGSNNNPDRKKCKQEKDEYSKLTLKITERTQTDSRLLPLVEY